MKTTTSTYEQQAVDFLAATGTQFSVKFLRNGKHFDDDKEDRDIYEVTLQRGRRKYTFNFGQSIINSGFYYTKGQQIRTLDRKLLGAPNLVSQIKRLDSDFLANNKSDRIHYPSEPTAYDVLTCVEKNEVGTFVDFCDNFGYDTDSRKAGKIYHAVKEEYLNISRLFNEQELEQLREIQ